MRAGTNAGKTLHAGAGLKHGHAGLVPAANRYRSNTVATVSGFGNNPGRVVTRTDARTTFQQEPTVSLPAIASSNQAFALRLLRSIFVGGVDEDVDVGKNHLRSAGLRLSSSSSTARRQRAPDPNRSTRRGPSGTTFERRRLSPGFTRVSPAPIASFKASLKDNRAPAWKPGCAPLGVGIESPVVLMWLNSITLHAVMIELTGRTSVTRLTRF